MLLPCVPALVPKRKSLLVSDFVAPKGVSQGLGAPAAEPPVRSPAPLLGDYRHSGRRKCLTCPSRPILSRIPQARVGKGLGTSHVLRGHLEGAGESLGLAADGRRLCGVGSGQGPQRPPSRVDGPPLPPRDPSLSW